MKKILNSEGRVAHAFFRHGFYALTSLLLATSLLYAQRQSGELRLEVLDKAGAALEASGTLQSQATGVLRAFKTKANGQYTFQSLPFGPYHLEVASGGFSTQSLLIEINSETPRQQSVTLDVAPVATTLEVSDSTLNDPSRTGFVQYLGPEIFRDRRSTMPGRSVLNLVNTQPGWLLEANGILHPRGSEYDVQYVIDGVPLYDNRSPAFAQSLSIGEYESMSVRTGGFPAEYGHDPSRKAVEMPSLGQIMSRLSGDLKEYGFAETPLVAEPGRVIVARCLSLIVRVLLRKGRRLYINDGIWASLSDSWTGKITLPARFIPDPAIRSRNGSDRTVVPFKVCGATCDSVDILSRPFWLPETVDTGDWIEIGHIGAYSLSLRTRFNGFYPDTFVEVATPFDEGDAPQGFASLETMAG